MRALPWLLLIAVAWFGGCQYARNREADARARELAQRIEARETVIAALARRKVTVDTQYLAAKPIYLKARQGWDSLVVTLDDKVKLDPVVLAGSLLAAACARTIAACEAKAAVRDALLAQKDTVIWAKDSLLTLERKRDGAAWKTKLGWLLAGAAAGVILQ